MLVRKEHRSHRYPCCSNTWVSPATVLILCSPIYPTAWYMIVWPRTWWMATWGHVGSKPNWKHHSFRAPRRAVLFIFVRQSNVFFLSCSSIKSLMSAVYHHLRLFIGFSKTVGIGWLLMKNVSLVSWPLTMEMLQDLLGLGPIFSWSLPSDPLLLLWSSCCPYSICSYWGKTVLYLLPSDHKLRCSIDEFHHHSEYPRETV